MAESSTGSRNAAIRVAVVVGIVSALMAGAVVWLTVWLAGPLLGFGGGGVGGPGGAGGPPPGMQGPPPASVVLEPAREREVNERFNVVGRLREVRRATVASEVEGKVMQIAVDEGDAVTEGQTVLARIDPVWAQLTVDAREADVNAAKATADQARRDFEQLEQLLQASSARPKEVDDARAKLDSALATLASAEAAVSRARESLTRVAVLAPFDGVVTRKLVEQGEWVDPGSGVVELISRGEIDAYIDVPERLINEVEVGETVDVTVGPLAEDVQGTVVAINPSGTNRARTFPVKVRLRDHDGRLKPGMSVTASLKLDTARPRLTVPRDAVQFGATGATVWIAAPGEQMPTAMPVGVNVLFGEGPDFVVEPAGGPGSDMLVDQTDVVVQGAERLFPTQPLIPAGAGGGSPEASEAPEADAAQG